MNETTTPRPYTGELAVLDRTGDTKTYWNKDDPEEVETARAVFNAMAAKGYQAFLIDGDGRGARMTAFDPAAERVVFAPQLQGG